MNDRLSSDIKIRGGLSETITNELAVIPCARPSYSTVITVIPLAKRPNAFRNLRVSNTCRSLVVSSIRMDSNMRPRFCRMTTGVSIAALLAALPALAQVDLTGEWNPRFHEDQPERIPGPEIGDYLGLPVNAAARMRADSWDASLLTLPEHQCKPHPSDYGIRGPANLRIWKEVDRDSQQLIAYHTHISWMAPERTIWMEGRPRPSEYAAHT